MALLSVPRKSNKGEAEKPFWISFSDLLTALMVLFLVAMAVAILAVTKGVRDIKVAEERRANSVDACMAGLQDVSRKAFKVLRFGITPSILAPRPSFS